MAWGRRGDGEKIAKCGNGVGKHLKSRDKGGKYKRRNFGVSEKRQLQRSLDGPC